MNTKVIFEGKQQRIDTRLSKYFSYSRNFFHHIISRGGIQVNGELIKKSYKLKNNDEILIDDLQRYLTSELLVDAPKIKIPILLEKDDYLIINKPKGVLSHPNSIRDVTNPSVVGFLYHHYQSLPSIGNFIRAGLIHRLDKDTNGLMIIVKTEKGLNHFKHLFQQKSEAKTLEQKKKVPLRKYYNALCIPDEKGKVFLENIKSDLPYVITQTVIPKVPHSVPKLGITQIESVDFTEKGQVDIGLQIFTGRTHQIRYHLSQKGLPIDGDYLYGKKEKYPMKLTANTLEFQDVESDDIITVTI